MSASGVPRPAPRGVWPRRWMRAPPWLDSRARPSTRRRRPTELAHDSALHRQPVTTLDDTSGAGCGSRRCATWSRGSSARSRRRRRGPRGRRPRFGPPILRPPSVRDFYAFEGHVRDDVGAPRRRGPRGLVPPADLLLQQHLGDPRAGAIRSGRRRPRRSSTTSWRSAALIDTPADRPVARAGGGGDRRLSRSSTTGPPGTSSARRPRSGWVRPRARTSPARSVRGWSRRTSWRTCGTRCDRLRPRDDGRGRDGRAPIDPDSAGPLVDRAVLVRGDVARRVRGRSPAGPATWSAAGPSGPAAFSRSATTTLGRYLEPGDEVRRSDDRAPRRPAATAVVRRRPGRDPDRTDDRRRLGRGPPHLRRGHRDRRRDPRARGAGLGPLRPFAPVDCRFVARDRHRRRRSSAGPP